MFVVQLKSHEISRVTQLYLVFLLQFLIVAGIDCHQAHNPFAKTGKALHWVPMHTTLITSMASCPLPLLSTARYRRNFPIYYPKYSGFGHTCENWDHRLYLPISFVTLFLGLRFLQNIANPYQNWKNQIMTTVKKASFFSETLANIHFLVTVVKKKGCSLL